MAFRLRWRSWACLQALFCPQCVLFFRVLPKTSLHSPILGPLLRFSAGPHAFDLATASAKVTECLWNDDVTVDGTVMQIEDIQRGA